MRVDILLSASMLYRMLFKDPVKVWVFSEGGAEDREGVKLDLSPKKPDFRWVMEEIVSSFIDLLVHYDPKRVKICENKQCRWVFYDESKNRSKRWCYHSTCGNRVNVRKFRRRKQSCS